MQEQNISEYKLIREELSSIKRCMTDYLGFILGGSGFAVFGLGFIVNPDGSGRITAMYASLALSLVLVFVLLVLMYKFNSHNRIAGYALLLNQERWKTPAVWPRDLMLWEVCVEILREIDLKDDLLSKINKVLTEDEKKLNPIRSLDLRAREPGQNFKGLKLLRQTLSGTQQTASWGFPIAVVRVFMALTSLFFVSAPRTTSPRRSTLDCACAASAGRVG